MNLFPSTNCDGIWWFWIKSRTMDCSNPLGCFKWYSYTGSSFMRFPKLTEIALVGRVAGHLGWARLIAPIMSGMFRLLLDCMSHMCAQPRSMRIIFGHAIKEHRHMPSRYLDPDWRQIVPSLTAQALAIVYPFSNNTCHNIVTFAVFESLYPIMLKWVPVAKASKSSKNACWLEAWHSKISTDSGIKKKIEK